MVLLKKSVLFQELSWKELKIVDQFLHDRNYLSDEVIFDEGEEGQGLFLILSGKVRIASHGASEKDAIAEFEAGDFFGELALIDPAPRMAQARAVENSSLVALFRSDLYRLIETRNSIASKILLQLSRHLSQRLRASIQGKDRS